jgi:hypothetical protein
VNDTARLSPPDRFTDLIEALMNDVAAEVVWGWTSILLIKLLWRRFRHMKARFASIMARFHAGTLPKAGSPPTPCSSPRRATTPRPAAAVPPLVLPRRKGWVLETINGTMIPGYELEKMVEDPELEALVADAPQLGRVLRPLCRMLAVKLPPWLRLPRRPRRPAEKHPPAPDWLVNEPGAELRADGTVWMRLGASTIWRPGSGQTLAEAQKFDRPRRIWPR